MENTRTERGLRGSDELADQAVRLAVDVGEALRRWDRRRVIVKRVRYIDPVPERFGA